jgi:hypothetical protein
MSDDSWASLGVVFMGLGAVAAGLLGIALPERRRLGAVFPLILGAGVGLAVLGVGASLSEANEPSGLTFFIGSLAGFATVCTASLVVWRRAAGEDLGAVEPTA